MPVSETLLAASIGAAGFLFLLALWFWRQKFRAETRTREISAQLRDIQEQITNVAERLPLVFFSFSPERGFESISQTVDQLLPVTREMILADRAMLINAFAPDQRRGLQWISQPGTVRSELDWVGLSGHAQLGEQSVPQRWLRLRATVSIASDGRRVLAGVISDVTALMEARLSAESLQTEIRQLSRHWEIQRENDYARLAREFHDEVGQSLNSARLELRGLQGRLMRSENRKALVRIDYAIANAYDGLKTIVADLRPQALNLGLPAAIEWLTRRILDAQTTIATVSICTLPLTPYAATSLYRIAQEALSNIARHARAKNVHLSLRACDGFIIFGISDDGVGFCPELVDFSAHFGLLGLRERALSIDGILDIDSAPNEGTRITVTAPNTGVLGHDSTRNSPG